MLVTANHIVLIYCVYIYTVCIYVHLFYALLNIMLGDGFNFQLICMFTGKIGNVTQFDEHILQVG